MTIQASTEVFSWGARSLFIGPSMKLSAHRNAVDVLAMGLDAPFDIWVRSSGTYRRERAVHIPANRLQHLTNCTGRMAFLYVDPLDVDRQALAAPDWAALFEIVTRLAENRDWRAAKHRLTALIGARGANVVDARVAQFARYLREHPGERPSLAEAARRAHLSPSRFRRLFLQTTFVPYRRYLVWIGVGTAMRAARRGSTLTDAALAAGFSSSAHFSAVFREMFGMTPSALLDALGPAPSRSVSKSV